MFSQDLNMPKRIRFLFASIFIALVFLVFLALPYEFRYYAMAVGVVLLVLIMWFGLDIKKNTPTMIRNMTVVLPGSFFIGYGLFAAIIPYSLITGIILSVFLGIIVYVIFLVENVFLFAVGYKTVPLYRAAYTVGSIIMLLTAFFLFDSLYSFSLSYWLNMVMVYIISVWLFAYHYFSVTIELPDDGSKLDIRSYVLLPPLLMSELALVLSFWPIGIFKGSIYLTAIIYVIAGLIQSDIRGRLFKKIWLNFTWIGIAIVLGIILMTGWR